MANARQRRTVRRLLQEAGFSHLLQRQSAATPLPPAPSGPKQRLIRILQGSWKVLTIVSTLLGFGGALLNFYPWLSMEQDFLFNPDDPYAASFYVVNEGYLTLTNVQSSCRSLFATPDESDIVFDNNEANGLQPTDKPPGIDQNVTDSLSHLSRVSITCVSPVGFFNFGAPIQLGATGRLNVTLFYKIFALPRRQVFQFRLARDRNSNYHWQSMGG